MNKFMAKNWFKILLLLLLLAIMILLTSFFLFGPSGRNIGWRTSQKNQSIGGPELTRYLSGVVEIKCGDYQGSGILWINNEIHSVLTNEHVVASLADTESCVVSIENDSKYELSTIYETVGIRHAFRWNNQTDIVVLPLIEREVPKQGGNYTPVLKRQTVPLKELNYEISLMGRCVADMPLGSPVMVIGYPASTIKNIETEEWIFSESSQTITDGIISALDDSVNGTFGNQIYPNYFISAKIDSGNSGGVVFSKQNNKVCLLGVLTWLNVGYFDAQGVVQNIHNVTYQLPKLPKLPSL